MVTRLLLSLVLGCCSLTAVSQHVERLGGGSYAAYPPAYKSKTDAHDGYNATLMMTRKIYCDESEGRPIPTNDWWTDIINNRYSGALWSYPAMLHTGDFGVRISYPSYWADEGKEIKSRTSISISALSFNPEATIASDWHDLDVTFRMPDGKNKDSQMRVTMAHGIPFTWFEYQSLTPMLTPSEAPTTFGKNDKKGLLGLKIGEDLYGVFYPAGTSPELRSGSYVFPDAKWIVVALLKEETDLEQFSMYAPGVIRNSKVYWNYNQNTSKVTTEWKITTENLRNSGETTPVILGLLPHVYKYSSTLPQRAGNLSYMTPRGEMQMYSDASGVFKFDYEFSGMMPYYAAPIENLSDENGFRSEVMESLMKKYADGGVFGADTYWGGKGLVQMALNMTFAKQCGDNELYETSRRKLREAFEDWLTYKPGEESMFFSYYPRWGSMLGFNVSYDSDAFNDHHFHYGYFTYAAALLCMEDKDFASEYGELLTLIVKDYANFDREDSRFPFMRTLDPWCGHSWAGGLGDAGNDNGNGQESTSEAMQSWGGLYLLGVALGNKEMRDAGIWGWSTEARATREYWFDVDAPRPANEGGRKPWAGKGDRKGNYDYSQYKYAYNSNITGKGIGWWTWFGGDPLFMHGIQWMPVSPSLDYLSWDNDFVDWAYDDMMSGANSTFSHEWFVPTYNKDNAEEIQPLADNDWGNVTLAYMQRSRPEEAASIFNRAYKENRHIASAVSTGHISYYLIHHHLTYGDIDFSITADIPTATAYLKDGVYSFMVYNPEDEERTVNFRQNGGVLRSVLAPARRLTVFSAPAKAENILIASGNDIIEPGGKAEISVRVVDQYGASSYTSERIKFSTDNDGVTVSEQGIVSVGKNIAKGTAFKLYAFADGIYSEKEFIVDDLPVISEYAIENLPKYIEVFQSLELKLTAEDTKGNKTYPEVEKWIIEGDGTKTVSKNGRLFFDKPGRYTLSVYGAKDLETPLYSKSIIVQPLLPDVSPLSKALSSSEENEGSKTESAIDGDKGSRWGSAHTDNEWLILDFGRDMYFTSATPMWEAAYASEYEYQVASANARLVDYTGIYAGEKKTIKVPAEDEWSTIARVAGNSHAGEVNTRLDGEGRYLRLKCIGRATSYGYSLYEIPVRGIPAKMSEDEIVGIDLGIPEVAEERVSVMLNPVAFTLGGASKPIKVEWSSDKDAEFTGNVFRPLDYGMYRLMASADAGMKSSTDIFVNEGIRPATIVISPDNAEGIVDEDISISLSVLNQFGGIYALEDMNAEIVVIDKATGKNVDPEVASYDSENGIFKSTQKGEYQISVNDGRAIADVIVKDVSEANLALGKSVMASGSVGGNGAAKINDNDLQTRWESSQKDLQWVEIDLEKPYIIDRSILNWEGAYSKIYSLSISMDGEEWWKVYDCNEGKGGRETISIGGLPAQKLRLDCIKRATEWGNSLYEWEIYGISRYDDADDHESPIISEFRCLPGNGKVDVNISAIDGSGYAFCLLKLCDAKNGRILESQSTVIKSGEMAESQFSNLPHGVDYMVKAVVKDPFGNIAEESTNFTSYLNLTGINIALGKRADATSAENAGLDGEKAVDGDYSTRWGSTFNNNESLTVDLGNSYSLTEIRIYWDDVAYATDYLVEGSEDGTEFAPIFSRTSWTVKPDDKGCRLDSYTIPVKTYARYLRLTGLRRATQYGTSIRELEIYADNDFGHIVGVDRVEIVPSTSTKIFNLQGIQVDNSDHPSGIYIIDRKKVMIK